MWKWRDMLVTQRSTPDEHRQVLRDLPFAPNTSDTLLVAVLPEVADEIRW
jgi:hypothetical protein